jgi:hypothetical protein
MNGPMDADMARMLRFVGDVQVVEAFVDDEIIEEQIDENMIDVGGEG